MAKSEKFDLNDELMAIIKSSNKRKKERQMETPEIVRGRMLSEGAADMVLEGGEVCDGSGQVRFPVLKTNFGHHNLTNRKVDLWFVGPCGMRWQAVGYGESKKLKAHRCTGIRQLMDQLGPRGIAISLKDGEYRVNFKHGKEETASYHTDPVDAFGTALAMLAWKDKQQQEGQ